MPHFNTGLIDNIFQDIVPSIILAHVMTIDVRLRSLGGGRVGKREERWGRRHVSTRAAGQEGVERGKESNTDTCEGGKERGL